MFFNEHIFTASDLPENLIRILESEPATKYPKAFIQALQLGAVDAWTLFTTLDKDGDFELSVDEFTERCMQLHGPAKSVDLFAVKMQNAPWTNIEPGEMTYSWMKHKRNMCRDECKSSQERDPNHRPQRGGFFWDIHRKAGSAVRWFGVDQVLFLLCPVPPS